VCGIAGGVDFDRPFDARLLHRMCRVMEHRGPDSRGVHMEEGVGLGVQRLAIIDVEGGDQPISNEDGTVAVVMNGEIYNHVELRERLQRAGHRFTSRVDTEVLVHLYEEHGDALVEHLRGMFAFAIWDGRRGRLLCARDRVGKKPLFWTRQGNRVLFASEVRSLLQDPELSRAIDPRAIDAYLTLQYVPHPLSAFREVSKLPPACTLSVDRGGVAVRRYWRLDHSPKLADVPRVELEEMLRSKLRAATRIRLMSDVPLGAFLSGGIDSSAIVAMMAEQSSRPVRTFSIGFEDREFDERSHARTVAERFGTDHQEFVVTPEAVSIMPRLARHYGEPFADASAIPSFYLADLTSREVTVVLNGDGGDETFAGYKRYLRQARLQRLDFLPRFVRRSAPRLVGGYSEGLDESVSLSRMRGRARTLAAEPWEQYSMTLTAFDHAHRRRLLSPDFVSRLQGWRAEQILRDAWLGSSAGDGVERALDLDVETYLPGDLLPKIDVATMAHSLEARSPFLDHKLMEFAASVPSELKLAKGSTKRLLRSALRDVLPAEILDRPKKGFSVPLARWFREDLRDLPRERLFDPSAIAREYFRPAEVERLIREHQSGKADHAHRLWVLLQLDTWHREVVDAPIVSSEPVV
jgi:asparagine synthase (glutamine-hydrolysing)